MAMVGPAGGPRVDLHRTLVGAETSRRVPVDDAAITAIDRMPLASSRKSARSPAELDVSAGSVMTGLPHGRRPRCGLQNDRTRDVQIDNDAAFIATLRGVLADYSIS
jgi:hypothetical protein